MQSFRHMYGAMSSLLLPHRFCTQLPKHFLHWARFLTNALESLAGCWVYPFNTAIRIWSEYIWLDLAVFTSIALYIPMYFTMRGHVRVHKDKWYKISFIGFSTQDGARRVRPEIDDIAKKMLWCTSSSYPILPRYSYSIPLSLHAVSRLYAFLLPRSVLTL